MMNSIAPFWDGNETWLVLGGGGLWVAFPQAYAVIMPAFYLPVIVMLLSLIFRGVSFEFRFVSKPRHRSWDFAFCGGLDACRLRAGRHPRRAHPGRDRRRRQVWRRPVRLGNAVRAALGRGARCAAMRSSAPRGSSSRPTARCRRGRAVRRGCSCSRCWSPSPPSACGRRSPSPAHRRALVRHAQHLLPVAGAAAHRRPRLRWRGAGSTAPAN